MERRRFLEVAVGGLAAGIAVPLIGELPESRGPSSSPRPSAPSPRRALRGDGTHPLDRIGVQLYTVRSLMAEDVEATLRLVSEIGYREVEFAGYFGHSPAEIRALLDGLGLDAPSAHVGAELFGQDRGVALEAANVVGHRYLVLPWLPPDQRGSLDEYQALADRMNRVGEACREAGIQFAYHNHDFEFVPVEGRRPYDVLLEACEPELVEMQIDLFWIRQGGGDPVRYFETHPGRFSSCHVKDMDGEGNMVDVGAGEIDFAAIFAHAETAGLRHYLVEHDQPGDPVASITASYRHLAALGR